MNYHRDMDQSESPFYSLAPTLLLSMPQLADPNFRKTVVLLCEHNTQGAFGLVVNRPTDTLASVVVQIEPPLCSDAGLRLWVGGPVEPHRGWILLDESPADSGSVEISAGLFLSTSPTLLRRVLEGPSSRRVRLLTGYAGWGPGQLDSEMAASSWLTADVDSSLVFDVEPALMWETAIRRLGADPATLQMGPGVH